MKRMILSLLLIMTLISSAALSYADVGGTSTPPEKVPVQAGINTESIKDDPLFGEIKGKYDQLVLLRTEQEGIMRQIKTTTEANIALEKQLKDGFKRDKFNDQTKVKDQFAAQAAELKALMDQRKSLLEQLKAMNTVKPEKPVRPVKPVKPVRNGLADEATTPTGPVLPEGPAPAEPEAPAVSEITSDKVPLGSAVAGAEAQALKDQIAALTVQIQEKAQALKEAKDAAVAGKEAANPLGDKMKNAHGQITALRAQIEAAHGAINRIQADKNQEWALFKADMESKNLADASAHMSTILEMKQQIIDKLKEILDMKQQINVILTALVAEIPASGASTVPVESLRAPAPDFLPDELEVPTL